MIAKRAVLVLILVLGGCATRSRYRTSQSTDVMTEHEAASTIRACVRRWATMLGISRDREPCVEVTPEEMNIDFRFDYIDSQEDWHNFDGEVAYAGEFEDITYRMETMDSVKRARRKIPGRAGCIVWLDNVIPVTFDNEAAAGRFVEALAILGATAQ